MTAIHQVLAGWGKLLQHAVVSFQLILGNHKKAPELKKISQNLKDA
jgi:hypothetical protein